MPTETALKHTSALHAFAHKCQSNLVLACGSVLPHLSCQSLLRRLFKLLASRAISSPMPQRYGHEFVANDSASIRERARHSLRFNPVIDEISLAQRRGMLGTYLIF